MTSTVTAVLVQQVSPHTSEIVHLPAERCFDAARDLAASLRKVAIMLVAPDGSRMRWAPDEEERPDAARRARRIAADARAIARHVRDHRPRRRGVNDHGDQLEHLAGLVAALAGLAEDLATKHKET